jgi:LAO/AO transport system kinase
MTKSGEFAAKRSAQQVKWLREMLEERLFAKLRGDARVKSRLAGIEAAVAAGNLSPMAGVEKIAQILEL